MKNIRIILAKFLLSLLLIPFSTLFAEDKPDPQLWTILYDQAKTLVTKRDKTKMIYEIATPEFKNLIITILKDASVYSFENDAQIEKLYEDWVFYACKAAGNLMINDAAPLIKTLYDRINSALYKGELLNSLGKTGNKEYLQWMNGILRKLNEQHRVANSHKNEEIVYGDVLGLTYFHDKSSFREIFYVSLPSYSDVTQKAAKEALLKITDDPAPLCTDIIKDELNFNIVLAAFRYAIQSNSPVVHKIDTAITALSEGIDRVIDANKQIQQTQRLLRDESTFYLGEFKSNSPITLELIKKKKEMDVDVSSILIDIEALTKIGSHETAIILTDWLKYYNRKKASGFGTAYRLKIDGDKILLAIIKSVGEVGDEVSLQELRIIKYSALYESSFKRAASEAEQKILKKSQN